MLSLPRLTIVPTRNSGKSKSDQATQIASGHAHATADVQPKRKRERERDMLLHVTLATLKLLWNPKKPSIHHLNFALILNLPMFPTRPSFSECAMTDHERSGSKIKISGRNRIFFKPLTEASLLHEIKVLILILHPT